MEAVNDNEKSEAWENNAWELCRRVDPDFYKSLRKKLPDHREKNAIRNYLWFVKFEHSFKQDEIHRKRNEFKVIT